MGILSKLGLKTKKQDLEYIACKSNGIITGYLLEDGTIAVEVHNKFKGDFNSIHNYVTEPSGWVALPEFINDAMRLLENQTDPKILIV